MANRLRVKLNSKPAITITRAAIQNKKLVYIARANKPMKYKWGHSRIVYIGTTQAGVNRIATSAAEKAKKLLGNRGIKQLEFHVVVSSRRPNVQTWKLLERALLLTFREEYGNVPISNSQGKNMRRRDERDYFKGENLRDIIHHFS